MPEAQITVIASHSLTFPPLVPGGKHYTVQPKAAPQQVPQWIADTDTFRLAAKGGRIYAINYVVPPPAVVAKPNTPIGIGLDGYGFNPIQAPTIQSLVAAGLSPDYAAKVIADQEAKAAGNDIADQEPVAVLTAPDAPKRGKK